MKTENTIHLFLFIFLQCHMGQALQCHSCIGDCTQVTTMECGADEQCVSRERRQDGNVQLQKGCVKSQDCNLSSTDPSFVQYCCNTDLCNAASSTTAASTSSASTTTSKPPRAPGSSLVCTFCDSFICPVKSTITCKPDEFCVTKKMKLILVPQNKYGCANATTCSTQTQEMYMGTTVSLDNECCNYNMCNSDATIILPSIITIGATMLLWLTKMS